MEFLTKFQLQSLQSRKAQANALRARYPDRVPVIVDRFSTRAPSLKKHKFLVACDITQGQFQFIFRKQLKLEPSEALFFFVDNTLVPINQLMSVTYSSLCHESGFLIMVYNLENAFGVFTQV